MNSRKSSDRPKIPLPIQREVRQRCGFGCVICGFPLYEYEHMEGWANVQRHVAEEITLLCDQHHREKTVGLLPLNVVREADKNPHNKRSGTSKPYTFFFSGDEVVVEIGGNTFVTKDSGYGTAMIPLGIDNVPVLGFVIADSHLLLNLVIFDEMNRLILHIRNNEMVYKTGVWDISFIGTRLIIREGLRKLLIEVDFQTPNKVIVKRGRFLLNGVEVLIRPGHLMIVNTANIFSGMYAENCVGGLLLGSWDGSTPSAVHMDGIPRYGWDRAAALAFEKETEQRLSEIDNELRTYGE